MPTWTKKTLFAILGIAAFSAISLGIYMAMLPGEEPERVAITAETTFPTTTEPPTTTLITTTTTSPSTTTTVPTTTTTTVPEPTYIWDGEADFRWVGRPARLGVLRDEWRELDGARNTILSGVFQGAYQKEITIAGDVVNAWFITMYMGEHPTTGRAMVVDFYIGDHPDTVIQRGDLSSDTIPEGPYNESRAEIYNTEPEVILKDLEVGRQYLFMMIVDLADPPDDIDARYLEVLESFFLKNKEVIDFLNGESENPLPADAFGWAYRVYFPNSL